jgi:hypothetical protein
MEELEGDAVGRFLRMERVTAASSLGMVELSRGKATPNSSSLYVRFTLVAQIWIPLVIAHLHFDTVKKKRLLFRQYCR